MMMWNGNGQWGPGGGWVTLTLVIVFVIAVIVATVFLARYLGQSSGGTSAPRPEAPRDIFKRRYAAGEIERDESLQKLGDL